MARLPIETIINPGDDLAPGFDLVISGKDTSQATQLYEAVRPLISSVTFEDDEEMSSMIKLKVINQPRTSPGQPVDWRAVIDSKAFAEGNFIDLFMGYGSQRAFMDRGEIVKWLPQFTDSGPGMFEITAYDGRHRMQNGNIHIKRQRKRKTFYKNLPDEGIVGKIADKYGYGVEVDTTKAEKKLVIGKGGKRRVFRTRVQGSDKPDWAFLQKLADMNNFDLWVDYDRSAGVFVVHFKEKEIAGQARYLFTYNGEDGSLISAEPEFSMKDQTTQVDVLVFDRKRRKHEITTISDTNTTESVSLAGSRVGPGQFVAKQEIKVGASVKFTAFGQTLEAFSDRPFKSKKEAATFVQNWLRERERDFLIIRGKVIGVADLRARQIHQLAGLGARLDGFYRFTRTTHTMDPGQIYTVEFTAHKVLSEVISRRKATTKATR